MYLGVAEFLDDVEGLLGRVDGVGRRLELTRANELYKFLELLQGARLDWFYADLALLGASAELGQETVGHVLYDEYDAALAQTLHAAVKAARRRAEVYDHVDLTTAGVHRAFDQLPLVQILAPLNHVHSVMKKKKNIFI